MKYEWIDEYLMNKAGVIRDLQKEWNWVRYKLGSKMFAAICRDDNTNEPYYITMKLEPMQAETLRSEYEDIIPGYYMNKTHWNSVKADGEVWRDSCRRGSAISAGYSYQNSVRPIRSFCRPSLSSTK